MTGRPDIRQRLTALVARRRNYKQEIQQLVARHPYVVFYGCGAIFQSIVDTWNRHIGRTIDFCCDSDRAKWGRSFCGIRCISPQELLAIKDRCAVFVTIGDFAAVFAFLRENKIASVNQIYKYDIAIADYLAGCSDAEIVENLCRTHDLLADPRSVAVFESIVQRAFDPVPDINVMRNVCEPHQYFPADVVPLTEHEALVDIGAFNGDTVVDFVKRTNGRFDRIYSFEVDAANFKALEETIRALPQRDRIEPFNLGIWDSECDITYSVGLSQSTVGEGEARGHVVPLDAALPDKKVTFIKMDIEGAEPQALRGAQGIIRHQKPKLAICIYHDLRHLWEIPLYIRSLVPEYKIYLRHHTSLEYETVCYAVL